MVRHHDEEISNLRMRDPRQHTGRDEGASDNDFRIEITIGYTLKRVNEFMESFSVKLMGEPVGISRQQLEECLSVIINAKTFQACRKEISTFERFAVDGYRLDYSSQILLFLASYHIRSQRYDEAIRILEIVVVVKDPIWSSLARCLQGKIYEDYLDKKELAYQAYAAILLDYPESLEVTYASRAIKRL